MRLLLSLGLAALINAGRLPARTKMSNRPRFCSNSPQTLPVKKIWGDNVGGGKKQRVLRLGLGPAIDDGRVFAASHKGEVIALSVDTGKDVWLKKLKAPLSAGPAVGYRQWWSWVPPRVRLLRWMRPPASNCGVSRELGAPIRSGHRPESRRSYAPSTGGSTVLTLPPGKELWQVEQQVPRLSLRGTATPIIAKDFAISGFDNGKVMAVNLNTGDSAWDTALASPHGRTELDRLVDIDSAVHVVGENVFAAGFQGRTAMLALDSGQIWWAHGLVELPRSIGR